MKCSRSRVPALAAVAALVALGGPLTIPARAADQAWQQSISQDVAAIEYHPAMGRAGLEAPNRAQNLRTHFQDSEIAIVARDAAASGQDWSFAWQLTRWGRPGSMQGVGSATPSADGARVTYARPALSEWYENKPEGVEQGFDVYAAPPGEGPLCLEGAMLGGLTPVLSAMNTIELVNERGDCVLRYDHLQVVDALGRELAASLGVASGTVTIQVDDRGARYPIAIDPLMTNAAWTVESNQDSAEFASAVAPAGDVNGDGFSDVLVGAKSFDNGQNNEGRAFLYLGSPTGLATSPAWTAESNQASANFGESVAAAGDVNGDGYADVIVGAPNWSNDEQDEGRAVVYLGSATGLATSPVWSVESHQRSAYFGMSVATAGDVNGDGYSDVIVGATFYDNDQLDEGRAFVYHGKPTGVSSTPAWTVESNQTQSWFGWPVATAGDVNGDGYSDVIVGASSYSNGQEGEGRAYVYHGSTNGLLTTASWISESNQAASHYGASVAGAGDVDGDGYADVIVGSSQYNNGQSLEGRAFAYHGTATGLKTTASWTAESNQVGAHFGNSVATAGDINADGYADVIIGVDEYDNGQSQEGRAVVYLGGNAGLDQTPIWFAESNQEESSFGQQVATAGDVNGDGFSDVIVGAPWYDNGQNAEGRAFVFLGAGGGTGPYPFLYMAVQQDGALGGSAVAPAGDINGDGYSDFVIGAPYFDNGQTDEGAGIVYYGEPDDTSGGLVLEFNQADAHAGTSIAGAGDVNGDGYADVIVGAPDYDNGQNNEGRVSVYLGSASGVVTTPSWTVESNKAEARFGWSVASAGDVNGDGYLDVIIGAPEFDNGQDNEGKAFVYLGSATGLATSPAWTAESNQVVAGFGYSVASAGDVNRDGFSDIVVGSYLQDNGESNEGRAFLYKGSASGLATSPSWSAESNQAGANFGTSVASAGDVNGDGFSDVIIGAPAFDNGQGDEGRAFVYLGSSGGLGTSVAWTGEGGQNGAQMGFSVASAGDVNLDGFSDVVIGLPYGNNGETEEGGALVIHGSASGLLPEASVILDIDQEFSAFGWAVAGAGDINGDGFADVLVGMPQFDTRVIVDGGYALAFMGNDRPENFGRDRIPRQARSNDAAPIGLLGKSQFQNGFLLKALGRTPAGRGKVWFEAEVKPLGDPFDGEDLAQSPRMDTGAPVMDRGSAVTLKNNVFGVTNNTSYRWRLRLRSNSPFFPGTPWFSMAGNAATETDLRTGGVQVGIEEPAAVASPFMLERIHPNPFAEPYELAYELPTTGAVRLVVYDVQGRVRALLADGVKERGRHVVRWNPLARGGDRLERGVYFVKLTVGARVETQKLILAP